MACDPHYNIHLITGKVQGGKTTLLSQLVERLKKDKLKITGFLSHGSFNEGQRSGFTLVDLEHGKQIPLATTEEKPGWLNFRRFFFNPEAFKEGEQWIHNGLSQHPDLVVIDEVGPMELERQGWWNILKHLVKRYDIPQLWIVRDQILPEIAEKWNVPEENIFRVDSSDQTELMESLTIKLINTKR